MGVVAQDSQGERLTTKLPTAVTLSYRRRSFCTAFFHFMYPTPSHPIKQASAVVDAYPVVFYILWITKLGNVIQLHDKVYTGIICLSSGMLKKLDTIRKIYECICTLMSNLLYMSIDKINKSCILKL